MSKISIFSEESPSYRWVILVNVVITTFLAIFSAVTTIIADDSIQGELALSNTHAIWITTLYLLGVNTTVPTATWFALHYGYKRVYTVGVLIFTVAAAVAGMSTHFYTIAAGRLLEGIGAGLIFPVGLALIVQNFPKEKIPMALNIYIGVGFGGGLGIGLPLSGYFAQFQSWRGLFFLIVPFGLASAVSCWISRSKVPQLEKYPFDFFGFASFATFIASLLIALTLGPIASTDEGWRSPLVLGCFLTAAICLLLTIFFERRHSHPLIPLVLFKNPLFSVCAAAMFLLGMSFFASVSVTANYMIHGLLYEKFVTGEIAMTYGITMAICSILSSQLIKVIPVPVLTFFGLSMLICSYFLNNELSWLTGPDQIFWILLMRGIGIGMSLGPTTFLALYEVPNELKNAAATLLTFFRQVGGTYGGTLIAIFSIRRTIFHAARFGEQANTQIPGYKATFQRLVDKGIDNATQAKAAIVKNIEIQAYIQGLNDALFVFGWVTAVVALILAGLIGWKALAQRRS